MGLSVPVVLNLVDRSVAVEFPSAEELEADFSPVETKIQLKFDRTQT